MSKEINIQVETIEVKCEVRPLRHKWKVCENNKEWYGRLPRKKKKQLKKRMGEESFVSWWNGLDVYYHPDVEEELKELSFKLRNETGACIMDCKMALVRFDYDHDKALSWLKLGGHLKGKLKRR